MLITMEDIVKIPLIQPAYDFTLKSYINQQILVDNITMRRKPVLLLPYAIVDNTFAMPIKILLKPSQVSIENSINNALNTTLIDIVLLPF